LRAIFELIEISFFTVHRVPVEGKGVSRVQSTVRNYR